MGSFFSVAPCVSIRAVPSTTKHMPSRYTVQRPGADTKLDPSEGLVPGLRVTSYVDLGG